MKGCGKLPFVLASLVFIAATASLAALGQFSSNAICEAHAAKATMYSLRSYFLKAKDQHIARRHSLNTVV